LFPATAPIDVVAVFLGLVHVTVSHVLHSATTRPKCLVAPNSRPIRQFGVTQSSWMRSQR
jgi:hypothetical protein